MVTHTARSFRTTTSEAAPTTAIAAISDVSPADPTFLSIYRQDLAAAAEWWRESQRELLRLQRDILNAKIGLDAIERTFARTVYADPSYKNAEARKIAIDTACANSNDWVRARIDYEALQHDAKEMELAVQEAEQLRRERRAELAYATAFLHYATANEDEKHR